MRVRITLEAADRATDADGGLVGHFTNTQGIDIGEFFQGFGVAVQRVAGDIKSQGLFFLLQFFTIVPLVEGRNGRLVDDDVSPGAGVEQAHLGAVLLPLDTLPPIQRLLQHRHEARTVDAGGIQCPASNQAFQHAFVHFGQVHPLAEVEDR